MPNPSAPHVGLQRPILNGEANFPVCLAPMVGLSHVGLRRLVRSYLPAGARTIWPTEMLNSRRLPHEKLGATPETARGSDECDLVPQILGNEEEPITLSVRKLEEWGASGIDINMGCPVQKALKHNYGVALMGDPSYAAEVVRMTVRHAQVPVSVKLRAGPQGDRSYLTEFVKGIEEAGAAWICLHPRTAEQKRRGRADWTQIGEIRAQTRLPVIGNGDIQIADDVIAMLVETGCDMAMAGRALTARPWLLWQVGESLGWAPPPGREGPAPRTPAEEGCEHGRSLLALIELFKEHFEESIGMRKLKFYIRTSHPWLQFGNHLQAQISKAQTYDAAQVTIADFFSREQLMVGRTELRQ